MALIRKAYKDDFEKVMPLLAGFNNPGISEDNWRGLFRHNWDCDEDYFGFILDDGGVAKGFIGTIFSKRVISGKVYKFCNLTSWFVEENYRSRSLMLLNEVMKLADYTITDLTASPKVSNIVEKFGFVPFEDSLQVLAPTNILKAASNKCNIELRKDIIINKLNDLDRQIFEDHKALNAGFMLIETDGGYSFSVYKKVRKKKLPFVHLHYISNSRIFAACKDAAVFNLCKAEKSISVIIENKLAEGKSLGIKRKLPSPRYYFSKELGVGNIDTLYSEMLILDL